MWKVREREMAERGRGRAFHHEDYILNEQIMKQNLYPIDPKLTKIHNGGLGKAIMFINTGPSYSEVS